MHIIIGGLNLIPRTNPYDFNHHQPSSFVGRLNASQQWLSGIIIPCSAHSMSQASFRPSPYCYESSRLLGKQVVSSRVHSLQWNYRIPESVHPSIKCPRGEPNTVPNWSNLLCELISTLCLS